MSLVTVERVLAMPLLREAAPRILTGEAGLDRVVRWVHSAEVAEIGTLLRGGDLLLSTGIALPDDAADLAAYADSLAASDAAGLFIELGRRWAELPQALVERCRELGLPLVALVHEVRFAAIAQAVGELIIDDQLGDLREAERVHDTFTDLSINEAGPAEILRAAQRLCGSAVVIEDGEHRVLDYQSGRGDVAAFLRDWSTRSRRVRLEGRSTWDPANGWLVTSIGRRERGWGRLVVEAPTPPSPGLTATAERAAAALAMHRLHDRDRDTSIRRTHHELLVAMLNDPGDADLRQRCELAGFGMHKRRFVAASLRPPVSVGRDRRGVSASEDLMAALTHAASTQRVPALVAVVDRDLRVLVSLPRSVDADRAVDRLLEQAADKQPVAAAVSRPVDEPGQIDRALLEAQQVLNALTPEALQSPGRRPYRIEDAHLRGLLTLLAGDDRLSVFVDRELEPLDSYDREHGTDLLETVRALLEHPVSKSQAAASRHLSRPAFYDRLAKAAQVLAADLDDPDTRVSLHVALLGRELAQPS